ncbi:hypothetical protein ANN_16572 [Periplaneta americana]|uniref:Catalase core domain-containing protein n=1 Tax=Periplaneta americana TaxID=6978 RepID=A0ABQ8SQS0_PERAM|nr:hypothetical protein ANN_16572 [Periplaneta americana]
MVIDFTLFKQAEDEHIQTSFGTSVAELKRSLTVGPRGPMLLQDVVFLDSMMSFAREQSRPERSTPQAVNRTRATRFTARRANRGVDYNSGLPSSLCYEISSCLLVAGAFGYFNVTQDITRYCKAKIFSSVGKRTRVAVRLSLAALDKGSPETVRDLHGFSVKFYTEDGIWDIVGFDTPVFFLRDAMLIPSLVHMILRNPVTNMKDNDMLWDFVTKVPEATYCVMTLLSDNEIPDGYRHMNGFAQNIFRMVNESGNAVYVKFHFLTNPVVKLLQTDQGVKNLMSEEAEKMSVMDPDYFTRDLYNAIANGDYPSWTMYIQVMTFEEAEHFRWNPFDVTKIWPEDEYELIKVGKLVLDRNPSNYFADVEQIALNPGNLVPGIEPSPDKVLQGRLLAYTDSQRHRVGENYLQLPINCPFSDGVTNYQRDGPMAYYSQGSGPNYYPNSFNGPAPNPWGALSTFNVSGEVKRLAILFFNNRITVHKR